MSQTDRQTDRQSIARQKLAVILDQYCGTVVTLMSYRHTQWWSWVLTEHGLTSAPTQYRLYGQRFLQVKRPNQQYQSTEGEDKAEPQSSGAIVTELRWVVGYHLLIFVREWLQMWYVVITDISCSSSISCWRWRHSRRWRMSHVTVTCWTSDISSLQSTISMCLQVIWSHNQTERWHQVMVC